MELSVVLSLMPGPRPRSLPALRGHVRVAPEPNAQWETLLSPPEGEPPTETGEWKKLLDFGSGWPSSSGPWGGGTLR